MKILDKLKGKKEKYTISEKVFNTIDPSIRPLITLCNENGIETYACCSGNKNEHKIPEDCVSGYLAFFDSGQSRHLVSNLMDMEEFNIAFRSAPIEDYSYFDKPIDKGSFGIYFDNSQGQNMQKVYDKFSNIISDIKVNKENRKIVDSIMKKLKEQSDMFEYYVYFKNHNNENPTEYDKEYKCEIDLGDVRFLDDNEKIENVELLVQDVSHILGTPDVCSDINRIYVPNGVGRNILPIIDLVKKTGII